MSARGKELANRVLQDYAQGNPGAQAWMARGDGPVNVYDRGSDEFEVHFLPEDRKVTITWTDGGDVGWAARDAINALRRN